MTIPSLFVLISLLFSNVAWSECDPVDFRSQLGPARDQGDSDLCFAYSAADLITQRTGELVSALDLATSYFLENVDGLGQPQASAEIQDYFEKNKSQVRQFVTDERNRAEIVGPLARMGKINDGEEDGVVLMSNVKGLCRESDFPSEGGFNSKDEKWLQSMAQKVEEHPEICKNWQLNTGVQTKLNTPVADCVNAMWLDRINKRCARNIPLKPLLPVTFREAADLPSFVKSLSDSKYDSQSAWQGLIDKMNSILDSGRITAISYNGDYLWDRTQTLEDHSSTVVARKKINNQCYYLVRDSFGANCDSIHKDLKGRCEKGHVWLSEDELTKKTQIYSIMWLN
jgi:hypothetical protein